jgi:hypothetical protein
MDQNPPSDATEVTTTHKRWFKRGDSMNWDKLEDYDRTWPTVPRVSEISSFFHGSLDATLLLHCVWIMALVLLLS